MSLQKSFERIRARQGVDWPTIKNKLIKRGVTQELIDAAVSTQSYGDKVYLVEILDESHFKELEALIAPTDKSSRSMASASGDTHSTGVRGAMLAVWLHDEAGSVNRMFLDSRPLPTSERKHALIIENEECFLNKEDTFEFVLKHCGITVDIEDVEFIYGSGNSISNKRIIPYLKAFEGEVYCLLDVDLGGLMIYSNLLAAGLPAEQIHYLIPDDLNERLARSRRQMDNDELNALSKVYGKSDDIDSVIRRLRHYETKLEQEIYRTDG